MLDATKVSDTSEKIITFVRGRETFIFRYLPGDEEHVLDATIPLVNRKDVEFDWFDAACVSHQLGKTFKGC